MENKIVFCKYTFINGGLTGAYFLLYYVLIEFLNMNYKFSNVISYGVTVLTAYYMTKKYVFKSPKHGKKEFVLFIVVRIAMVGVSTYGLWIFVNKLGAGEYISFIVINAICFFASYLMNKWIFAEAFN